MTVKKRLSVSDGGKKRLPEIPVYRVKFFETDPTPNDLDPLRFQIATVGQPAVKHLLYDPQTKKWGAFATRESALVALARQNEKRGGYFKVCSPLGNTETSRIFSVNYSRIRVLGFELHRFSPVVTAMNERDVKRAQELVLIDNPFRDFENEIHDVQTLMADSQKLPEARLYRGVCMGLSLGLNLYYSPFSIGMKGLVQGLDVLAGCLPKEHPLGASLREFTTCFRLSQRGGAAHYAVSASLASLVIGIEKVLDKKLPEDLRRRFVLLGAAALDVMQNPIYIQKSASKEGVQCVSHELSTLGLEAHSALCERDGHVYYEFEIRSPVHGVLCTYQEKTTPTGSPSILREGESGPQTTDHVLYVKEGFDYQAVLTQAKSQGAAFLEQMSERISELASKAMWASGSLVYAGALAGTRGSMTRLAAVIGLGVSVLGELPYADSAKTQAKKSNPKSKKGSPTEEQRKQFVRDFRAYFDYFNKEKFSSSPMVMEDKCGSKSPRVVVFAEHHGEAPKQNVFYNLISHVTQNDFSVRLFVEGCLKQDEYQKFYDGKQKKVNVDCWDDSSLKKQLEVQWKSMNSHLKGFYAYLQTVPELKVFTSQITPFNTTEFYEPEELRKVVDFMKNTYTLRGLSAEKKAKFESEFLKFADVLKSYFDLVREGSSDEGSSARDVDLLRYLEKEVQGNPDGISLFEMGYKHSVAALKWLKEKSIPYVVIYTSKEIIPRGSSTDEDLEDEEPTKRSDL